MSSSNQLNSKSTNYGVSEHPIPVYTEGITMGKCAVFL